MCACSAVDRDCGRPTT